MSRECDVILRELEKVEGQTKEVRSNQGHIEEGDDDEITESNIELEDDQSLQEWCILLVGTRTYACNARRAPCTCNSWKTTPQLQLKTCKV